MDTYMHKTMVSVASLEKIEIIRSQEFILGPKTAILGPQFCRILVMGPHFWWSGGPPGSTPALLSHRGYLISIQIWFGYTKPTKEWKMVSYRHYIS